MKVLYVAVEMLAMQDAPQTVLIDVEDYAVLSESEITMVTKNKYDMYEVGDKNMIAKLILSNITGRPVTRVRFANGNLLDLRRANITSDGPKIIKR